MASSRPNICNQQLDGFQLVHCATALTIAGSDSGGGAGLQADLAAFTHFNVFGTTAVTAVTAQNPHLVSAVTPLPPEAVKAQIEAVLSSFTIGAVKTGMLFRVNTIEAVADALSPSQDVPLVVDPVMLATSGARLLEKDAVNALRKHLFPHATLITPNLPEASILVGRKLQGGNDEVAACRQLHDMYGAGILLKGGHGDGPQAVDILCLKDELVQLTADRVDAPTTHGTGCSLSAAITASLAAGLQLKEAVCLAKAYVLGCLRSACKMGLNTWVLSPPTSLPTHDISIQYAP